MTRKQSFTFDNMKAWPKLFKKLPARQQKAFYMTVVCALIFVVVAVASTMLVFGSAKQQAGSGSTSGSTTGESGYNKDANSIAPEQMSGTVLAKTADAGQNYQSETLFVGDSNTVRLHEVYNLLPLENYMGMVGMTIQGATSAPCVFFQDDITVYTIPDAIKMVQPRRIIMSFGTNNATGETSTDSFIKHYKNAIKAIQTAYSHAEIIVASIPPCGLERDYPNVSQKTIDEFNKALVKMCEGLDLKYLNTAEEFKDPTTGYIKANYISADGLHLSEAGDRAWLTYARTHASSAEDKRPTVTNVPVRQEAPKPVAGVLVPPTCTETGYTPYTLWDKTIDRRDVVPALGHDFVKGVCSRCGVKDPEYVASSVPAHAHDFSVAGAITTAATCTAKGSQTWSCAAKDGATTAKEIAMIPHAFKDGSCTVCKVADPDHVKHVHDLLRTVSKKDATCTTEGTQVMGCSVVDDGGPTVTNVIPPLLHTPDTGTPTPPATCTTAGSTVFKCKVCGVTISTTELPALGHTIDGTGTCPVCKTAITPPPAS